VRRWVTTRATVTAVVASKRLAEVRKPSSSTASHNGGRGLRDEASDRLGEHSQDLPYLFLELLDVHVGDAPGP
jgi:hypothetical protein